VGHGTTPQRSESTQSFRGIPATGRPISFVEHVFDRYQGGKIAEIWPVIDMDAVREQLTHGRDR
jgi:predicted ester cyclase